MEEALADFTGGVDEEDLTGGHSSGFAENHFTGTRDGSGSSTEDRDSETGESTGETDDPEENGDPNEDGDNTTAVAEQTGRGAKTGSADPDRSTAAAGLARESIECVVIGYTTNAAGEPRSLLLAAPMRERLVFVAKVSLDQVEPAARIGMQDRLMSLHQNWPITNSPFGGRWLKPELFCQVQFSGWSVGGRLTDPYVIRFAVVTTPVDAGFSPTAVSR
jgi:hypothetical protein